MVWDAENRQRLGLNASGRSPHDLTLDYFKKNDHTKIPSHGPLPVSVPGWFSLHDSLGSLPMKDILQPAINYAYTRDGFPVSELVAYYW